MTTDRMWRVGIGLAAATGLCALLTLAGMQRLAAAEGMNVEETAAAPDEIERFCGNVADAARERRYANQARELATLKADIDARIVQLEAKKVEYEKWMKLRQDFIDKASEQVVQVYGRMKPDAAAERLTSLKSDLAAAILMKLNVKQSGLIMNEMQVEAAAKLTGIMASASRKEDPS
ncbi:MAG: MotE family protein [Mesorhizobium sp.]